MYVPDWFRVTDQDTILRVIRNNSFATLVTVLDGVPVASHVPVVIEAEDPLVLVAHIAAKNPQATCLDGAGTMLVVFSGPHAYVSPRDYETSPNVPTWNYVAVHATGVPQRIDDTSQLDLMFEKLVSEFDPELKADAPENTSLDFYRPKYPGIVAFRMVVDKLEAKAKLSQNKPDRDRLKVAQVLQSSSEPDRQRLGKLMGG